MRLQPRIRFRSLALVLLLAACGGDDDDDATTTADDGAPVEAQEIEVADAGHVDTDVTYEQSPPVGGDHNPAWQNCGVYREPVLDENAVHSLEHGAVWIAYSPDLDATAIEQLDAREEGQTHVLVSPYEGDMAAPISLQAWGRQLAVDDAGDDSIDAFIRAFQEGPQTPEPGAPCSGALGAPR